MIGGQFHEMSTHEAEMKARAAVRDMDKQRPGPGRWAGRTEGGTIGMAFVVGVLFCFLAAFCLFAFFVFFPFDLMSVRAKFWFTVVLAIVVGIVTGRRWLGSYGKKTWAADARELDEEHRQSVMAAQDLRIAEARASGAFDNWEGKA